MSLRGLASMATRGLLADLATAYSARCGVPVDVECTGGVDAVRRIEAGESFDFVVLAADVIDRLGSRQLLDVSCRADVAQSCIAMAVAEGRDVPRIDTADQVRDVVRAARTVGYSTGPSGTHLLRLLAQWDVRGAGSPQLVQAPPGVAVGTLVADGRADIGFQQASELSGIAGVRVVGLLPGSIQAVTVFTAARRSASQRPEAVAAFLAFLASPDTAAAKRQHSMEPAAPTRVRLDGSSSD